MTYWIKLLLLIALVGLGVLSPAYTQSHNSTDLQAYIDKVTPSAAESITRDEFKQVIQLDAEGRHNVELGNLGKALELYKRANTIWTTPIGVNNVMLCYIDLKDWLGFKEQLDELATWSDPRFKDFNDYYQALYLYIQGIIANNNNVESTKNYLNMAYQALLPFKNHPFFGKRANNRLSKLELQIASLNKPRTMEEKLARIVEIESAHINNIIEQEAGTLYTRGDFVWNSNAMPLKVFVANGSHYQGFDSEWLHLIDKGLEEWSVKTNRLLTFADTNNKENADIIFEWTTNQRSLTAKGEIKEKAVTHSSFAGNQLLRNVITIATVTPQGKKRSDALLYQSILHELGHALGLGHHSPDRNDVMGVLTDYTETVLERGLSQHDIAMLIEQYKNPGPHVKSANSLALTKGIAKDFGTRVNQSANLVRARRFDEAIKSSEELDELYPNVPMVHLNLVYSYFEKKNIDKLGQLAKHWQEISPGASITKIAQGTYEEMQGNKAFKEHDGIKTVEHFEKALSYYEQVPESDSLYKLVQDLSQTVQKKISLIKQIIIRNNITFVE